MITIQANQVTGLSWQHRSWWPSTCCTSFCWWHSWAKMVLYGENHVAEVISRYESYSLLVKGLEGIFWVPVVIVVQKLRQLLLVDLLVPSPSKIKLGEASAHVERDASRLPHHFLELKKTHWTSSIPLSCHHKKQLKICDLSKSWKAVLKRASGWQRCASNATNSENEMRPSWERGCLNL